MGFAALLGGLPINRVWRKFSKTSAVSINGFAVVRPRHENLALLSLPTYALSGLLPLTLVLLPDSSARSEGAVPPSLA